MAGYPKHSFASCIRVSGFRGFTLLEVVVALVVLTIGVLGVTLYQFYAVQHRNEARIEIGATRTIHSLIEEWKSRGGAAEFDPSLLGLGINLKNANVYTTTVEGVPMEMTLTSRDVATDEETGAILRQLDIQMRWRQDHADGALETNDPSIQFSTYVRPDQTSG